MTKKREWCMTYRLKSNIQSGLNFQGDSASTSDLVTPGGEGWKLVSHHVLPGTPLLITWCWERDIEVPDVVPITEEEK